jgi:Carboxypeptidase regulatory-like domain
MRQVAGVRAVLLGLLLVTASLAQRDLGTITGTVTDPTGAAIPGAKVTITEVATNLSYTVTTGASGDYTRPALKPGIYTVAAEAQGFRRVAQENVVVNGGDRVGVPLTLPVGNLTETVEVSAQAPLLQTENTNLGATLNSQSMQELPLGGQRTFTFLARLSAAVVPNEPGARDAAGGGFSANGVRSNGQNNFLLNGVDNNVNVIDFLNQTAFVVGPSVEAIGEMNVLTSGYNAEYGRGAGGVLNVNLKSGTNDLHGVLFEYLQNTDLDANRWEQNKASKARPPYRQNQFGAAAGGPIIKNRTFIFGDYQGTRIASSGGIIQNLGYGGFYTIPTPAMIGGDFSQLLGGQVGTDVLGNPIYSGEIYDPASTRTVNGQLVRDPFQGNIIPKNRFDPAAAKLLAYYPAPNQPIPTGGYPQNDYFTSTPGTEQIDQGDVRVDHRISDKDSLFGSLSWSNTEKALVPPFGGPLDGGNFQGSSEVDLGRNAQIGYTRVWTPTIISETRVGFSRLVTSRVGQNPNTDVNALLGIGGLDQSGAAQNGGIPQMDMQRYSQIGANNWLPSKEYSNVWDFVQNVAITRGSHALKFGAEFRPIRFPFFQTPYPHGEEWIYQDGTAYPSQDKGSNGQKFNVATGDEMASLLLGVVAGGQISTNNFISSNKQAWAFYGQDDWKITPKLTLSYGLRYELFSPIGEAYGRQSNFVYDNLTLYIPEGHDCQTPLPPNFGTSFPNVTVDRCHVSKDLIPWDKADFGPRLGIAYALRQKTVLRLGYGIFYGGEENQGGNPNRGESVPFNESVVLNRPGDVSLFATNPYFPQGFSGGFPTDVYSLPAPIAFRGVATDFRSSMVQKWSVAVEQQLPAQMALTVSYIGNHQSHQLFQPDWNACPNFGTTDSSITCLSLRPTPYIGGISGTASFGYGDYKALAVELEKRLSKGLQFISSYTFGSVNANTGTTLSGSPGFGTPDPRNYASGYSAAAWDVRHSFTTGFNWEVPLGKGKAWGSNMSRAADALIGGWQFNGIVTIRTGFPYTLRYNGCQGVWNACQPDLVSGMSADAAPSGGRTPDNWFNTAAIVAPAPLTGGNVGLQTNRYPNTQNLDFSLFKMFKISERFGLEFRAESFNLFNTPQFNNPDNNLQDANFGKITSTYAGSERHLQLALRLQF